MMSITRKQWTLMANVLRYVGFGLFLIQFISLLLLDVYSARRPHIERPEFGWTVELRGVKPAPTYGTSQDQARLDQLFFLMIATAIPIVAGECIFMYKLNIDRSSVGRIKF